MNVYDNANELAKAMRESHEFKKLKEATAVLNKDENAKKMVNEFLSLNQQAEMEKYQGKTVRFKGRVVTKHRSLKNCFVCGRHVMTCCVEDIQFAALVCQWDEADTVQDDTWMVLTAKIDFKFHRAYGRKGPVLSYLSAEPCPAPEQPVATFY